MCHYSILACLLGLQQSSNSQHSPLSRANQAAAAAAAANVALAARRGSYPLSAVAALTAAQQRNLAALSGAAAGGVAVSTVAATLPSNVSVVTGVGSMRGGRGLPRRLPQGIAIRAGPLPPREVEPRRLF